MASARPIAKLIKRNGRIMFHLSRLKIGMVSITSSLNHVMPMSCGAKMISAAKMIENTMSTMLSLLGTSAFFDGTAVSFAGVHTLFSPVGLSARSAVVHAFSLASSRSTFWRSMMANTSVTLPNTPMTELIMLPSPCEKARAPTRMPSERSAMSLAE